MADLRNAGCSGEISRWRAAASLLAVVLGCGSDVDGRQRDPSSASGAAAGGGGETDGTGGAGGQSASVSSGGAPNTCDKPCESCTVCNDVECLQGLCDYRGSCEVETDVACTTGGASDAGSGGSGGGGGGCPADVQMGEPCTDEGVFCPSEGSCSGVLQCIGGQWTLTNPC
jgi:hypothetical protein